MKSNEEIARWVLKQIEKVQFDTHREVIYQNVKTKYPEFWKEFSKEIEKYKLKYLSGNYDYQDS